MQAGARAVSPISTCKHPHCFREACNCSTQSLAHRWPSCKATWLHKCHNHRTAPCLQSAQRCLKAVGCKNPIGCCPAAAASACLEPATPSLCMRMHTGQTLGQRTTSSMLTKTMSSKQVKIPNTLVPQVLTSSATASLPSMGHAIPCHAMLRKC